MPAAARRLMGELAASWRRAHTASRLVPGPPASSGACTSVTRPAPTRTVLSSRHQSEPPWLSAPAPPPARRAARTTTGGPGRRAGRGEPVPLGQHHLAERRLDLHERSVARRWMRASLSGTTATMSVPSMTNGSGRNPPTCSATRRSMPSSPNARSAGVRMPGPKLADGVRQLGEVPRASARRRRAGCCRGRRQHHPVAPQRPRLAGEPETERGDEGVVARAGPGRTNGSPGRGSRSCRRTPGAVAPISRTSGSCTTAIA